MVPAPVEPAPAEEAVAAEEEEAEAKEEEYTPAADATTVVVLSNVVTDADLASDAAVAAARAAVSALVAKCGHFGPSGGVVGMEVPAPSGSSGAGKVFVEMSDTGKATKCRDVLEQSDYQGRTVEAAFYPYNLYLSKTFDPNDSAAMEEDLD